MTNNRMQELYNFPPDHFLGFENIVDELQKMKKVDKYPPHNIVKVEDGYEIHLAVAGFPKENLHIETNRGLLTVSGEYDDRDVEYIHRGISTKRFEQKFRLSEFVVPDGASFKNGLLVVKLRTIIPENMQPRIVKIT